MHYGRTDEELARLPLVFRDDLFKGQVALVTGGGRGIGKAIAFQLARLGAKVAITGRNAERLEAAAASIAEYTKAEVLALPMTIREPEQVATTVSAVAEQLGPLDVLVNNAGGQFPQAAIDFKPKGWNAVIDTNLNGTWYMMQAAARHWRDTGRGGAIVNIVAVYDRGMPGIAHTAAARAGVAALSKTVAVEWAPLGIRVNCIAPGVIETEGMDVYPEEARSRFPQTNPMKRMGDVSDVANAVCYLAGPTGAFVTGEVVHVDGGGLLWGDLWTIPKPDYFREG
jgi:citronellol/citronellal dehydrogenase